MARLKYLIWFVLFATYFAYSKYGPSYSSPKNQTLKRSAARKSSYKILLWTKLWANEWRSPDLRRLGCQWTNCEISSDRTRLNGSDAVLFHLRDISAADLPGHHWQNQSWVLFNWEPPIYSPISRVYPVMNDIDWVMSYRRDADVYSPYGRIVRCAAGKWRLNRKLFGRKRRSVAWMVSNCNTTSRREKYVSELANHIDVDVFGKCGAMKCEPKFDESCYRRMEREYKFYLAFENSFCEDYVTEKLFHIIRYDIIPIVYGSANYSQIMPKNSYIDVNDYSSPQELVKFLKILLKNEKLYNSYFEWKRKYCSVESTYNSSPKYFCDLCEKLNSESSAGRRRAISGDNNLIDWIYNKAHCI